MQIKVTVKNAAGLARKLRALGQSYAQAAPHAIQEAAELVAETAKALAPKRTGKLAGSIEVVADHDGASVVAEAPYASFVEFGTLKKPARPFLGPALRSQKGEVLRRLIEALRKVPK
jgi:HK97 gp10 family phage protein